MAGRKRVVEEEIRVSTFDYCSLETLLKVFEM